MKINSTDLKQIEKNRDKSKAFSRDIVLSSYLKILHNLIAFHENSASDETAQFINSLNHWCNDRSKNRKTKRYCCGDIVEVEFGIKYKSEISYRHSALVIKDLGRKVFVIPTTSNISFLSKAYHPVDNNNGDWYLRKVDTSSGFDHPCVLVINDICSITKNRVLSKCGKVENSNLLNEIKTTIIKNVFTDEIAEYNQKLANKDAEIDSLKNIVEELKTKNNERKEKINSLYKTINKLKNK